MERLRRDFLEAKVGALFGRPREARSRHARSRLRHCTPLSHPRRNSLMLREARGGPLRQPLSLLIVLWKEPDHDRSKAFRGHFLLPVREGQRLFPSASSDILLIFSLQEEARHAPTTICR